MKPASERLPKAEREPGATRHRVSSAHRRPRFALMGIISKQYDHDESDDERFARLFHPGTLKQTVQAAGQPLSISQLT